MKVAVVGLGAIGSAVARHLTDGGVDLIVSQRKLEKAERFADELGNHVQAMSSKDAVEAADVVILAVWFDVSRQLISEWGAALKDKIVVDPSNPIKPDGKGGFEKTIPKDQSSGQILAELLPAGTRLVKAFGSLSAESLSGSSHRKPELAVLFYTTDDEAAGATVASLIEAAGFAPQLVGGLDQSIRIEVGGDLHEFGKLGRLVTPAEGREAVS